MKNKTIINPNHNLQTSRHMLISLILLLTLFLTACIASADFDVRGEWEYTMYAKDGHTYDMGIISFSGSPMSGNYQETNIYEVEYSGTFTIQDEKIRLTGYENWAGEITDENTITGSWVHDDGTQGTFEAIRKTE